jgi:hypothetical protein
VVQQHEVRGTYRAFLPEKLAADNEWKTLSTRVTYEGCQREWIVPRWGVDQSQRDEGSRG